MALEITDGNFEELVMKSGKPVVVDFWAAWCGPCRKLAPIIDKLAEANPDIAVGKLNVYSSGITAAAHGIRSIPTIMFFQKGELVKRLTGIQPQEALQEIIDSLK